jgi:hypothetical protein
LAGRCGGFQSASKILTAAGYLAAVGIELATFRRVGTAAGETGHRPAAEAPNLHDPEFSQCPRDLCRWQIRSFSPFPLLLPLIFANCPG